MTSSRASSKWKGLLHITSERRARKGTRYGSSNYPRRIGGGWRTEGMIPSQVDQIKETVRFRPKSNRVVQLAPEEDGVEEGWSLEG